jgi:flagellar basal body-associated protein FliL
MDDVKKRDKRSLLIALIIAGVAVFMFAIAIYMGAGMQAQ